MRNLVGIVTLSLISCQAHERFNKQLMEELNQKKVVPYVKNITTDFKADIVSIDTTFPQNIKRLSGRYRHFSISPSIRCSWYWESTKLQIGSLSCR